MVTHTHAYLIFAQACGIKNDRHDYKTAFDLPLPERLIDADKEKEREKDESSSSSVTRD